MRRSKKDVSPRSFQTLLAKGVEVTGDIEFSDGVCIEGKVVGNLKGRDGADAFVSISADASVKGDILVPRAVISGSIEGDITVTDDLELTVTARVKGNIYYKSLSMDKGAQVQGSLTPLDEQSAAAKDKSMCKVAEVKGVTPTKKKVALDVV